MWYDGDIAASLNCEDAPPPGRLHKRATGRGREFLGRNISPRKRADEVCTPMPQLPTELLNTIGVILELIVAAMTALLVAFWVGLVVWTFRDIRSRTRDVFAWLLATVLVLVLGPIGWLLYFLLRPRETLAQVYDRQLEEEVLLRDITVRRACPKCQAVTEAEWLLCPHCGVELRQKCADCGRPLELDWIACPYCTAPVANAKSRGKLRAAAQSPVAPQVVYTPEPAVDAGPMPQPSFEPRPTPATE